MRGRVKVDEGQLLLGGLTPLMPRILAAPRILIVACGTSWHAGLLGEYLIETLARSEWLDSIAVGMIDAAHRGGWWRSASPAAYALLQ